jgi:hypothetical protein
MEDSVELPAKKNLKIDLPYKPAIPFLGKANAKEMKLTHQRNTCTPMLIVPLFTIASYYPFMEEWIKKMSHAHTHTHTHTHTPHNGILFCHKE